MTTIVTPTTIARNLSVTPKGSQWGLSTSTSWAQ